jgi:hypothetical protein
MVTIWRVKHRYSHAIEKVQAEKVSDKSVFFDGGRVSRVADGTQYFDDFDSAKKFAVEQVQRKVTAAEKEILRLKGYREFFEKLTAENAPQSSSRW